MLHKHSNEAGAQPDGTAMDVLRNDTTDDSSAQIDAMTSNVVHTSAW